MGNNNNALETPTKPIQTQPNQQQNDIRDIKLEPITFQQFGPHLDSNLQQKKMNKQSLAHTPSKFSNLSTKLLSEQATLAKSSDKAYLEINLQTLGVINEHHQIQSQIKGPITVPFEVVKLTLQKELLETIVQYDNQFTSQLQKLNTKWYLTPKGFYANRNEKIITIVKPGNIYQGEFIQNGEDIIPNGAGKLITKQGIFKGALKQGRAHGIGSYQNKLTKTEYKGVWRRGDLMSGQIARQDFLFEGRFNNNVADGPGVITFTKQKCSYKGIFRDGVYQDENGYFQSDIYAYSGGFKSGHKDGEGCLIEKERNVKSSKKSNNKYHPQMEYQGFFQNDIYVGKKKYALKAHS